MYCVLFACFEILVRHADYNNSKYNERKKTHTSRYRATEGRPVLKRDCGVNCSEHIITPRHKPVETVWKCAVPCLLLLAIADADADRSQKQKQTEKQAHTKELMHSG